MPQREKSRIVRVVRENHLSLLFPPAQVVKMGTEEERGAYMYVLCPWMAARTGHMQAVGCTHQAGLLCTVSLVCYLSHSPHGQISC